MPTTRLAHRAALKDTRVNIRLQELADSLPDVIRMGRGDPDFDTPAHIVRAGQEALAKGATHYTHAQGILPLRQAIAKDILARIPIDADYGQIISFRSYTHEAIAASDQHFRVMRFRFLDWLGLVVPIDQPVIIELVFLVSDQFSM